MTDRNVFHREVVRERGQPSAASARRPAWLVPGLIAGIALLIAGLFLGSRLGDGHDPGLEAQLGALEHEVEALRATPTSAPTAEPCQDGAAYLAIVAGQEQRAEWEQAAASARSALAVEDICAVDRRELARKAITDGLNASWAVPAAPANPTVQQAAIDRYRELVHLAGKYAVPFPLSARQAAGQAYAASQFALATVLVEEAVAHGEIAAGDPLQARFAAAAYYNQGYHYAVHGPDQSTRDEGLRLLLTAHLIDRGHQLGINEAWRLLGQLLGSDERLWTWRVVPVPSAFLPTHETERGAAHLPSRLR